MPLQGFPPIASQNANLLILGSMPGEMSLQKQQYYAHPRNAFWLIMQALFDIPANSPYESRIAGLLANRVAVWDVLQSCQRRGSLDADIDKASICVNRFGEFFASHPQVEVVCFNGGSVEKLYKRYVERDVRSVRGNLHYLRLPSTSPAYAAMGLPEKISAWQAILPFVVKW